jgi:glucokinase
VSHVLAGDVGGTRARFALFDERGKKLVFQDVLESRTFSSFEAALQEFLEGDARKYLKGKAPIAAASFGIAGPVVDQRVKTTNLPWTIDGRVVERTFGIPNVTLLNDLVAVGLGAIASPPSKLCVVHNGCPKKTGGNLAVIAAGTGLGEAAFIWDGEKHVPSPTEGGHTDFAPRSPVEIELLSHLASELGQHVSYEDVCAGSKISLLYRFFVKDRLVKEPKDTIAHVTRAPDANVAVVELAEKGKSEAAMRALELWCSVYGAEAGNLALKTLASGGVFVAGGVSARLAPILAKGLGARKKGTSPFVEAFVDKGKMRALMETIPVVVTLEPRAGLLGSAAHAAAKAATRKVRRSRKA